MSEPTYHGTFETSMYIPSLLVYGDIEVKGLKTASSLEVKLKHKGIYKHGEEVTLLLKTDPNDKKWEGTTSSGQRMIMTVTSETETTIEGTYVTHMPADNGTFKLCKNTNDARAMQSTSCVVL